MCEGVRLQSRQKSPLKRDRALQAEEKLDQGGIHGAVLKGHDFNRAINGLK
jgi:hypothetical protein